MTKLEPGVWFSKKTVALKHYVATFFGKTYNILAVDLEMANQKAQDHFNTTNFTLKEIQ